MAHIESTHYIVQSDSYLEYGYLTDYLSEAAWCAIYTSLCILGGFFLHHRRSLPKRSRYLLCVLVHSVRWSVSIIPFCCLSASLRENDRNAATSKPKQVRLGWLLPVVQEEKFVGGRSLAGLRSGCPQIKAKETASFCGRLQLNNRNNKHKQKVTIKGELRSSVTRRSSPIDIEK